VVRCGGGIRACPVLAKSGPIPAHGRPAPIVHRFTIECQPSIWPPRFTRLVSGAHRELLIAQLTAQRRHRASRCQTILHGPLGSFQDNISTNSANRAVLDCWVTEKEGSVVWVVPRRRALTASEPEVSAHQGDGASTQITCVTSSADGLRQQ